MLFCVFAIALLQYFRGLSAWEMKIISKSVNDTLNLGAKLAKGLSRGDIVCLFGELGAGKTVLVKGIASGLGIDKDKIISPTFVLMKQYTTKYRFSFYHLDFYRLKDCADIFALGYEEFFYSDGITVIEWPQRLGYLMPEGFLKIELFVKSETDRLIKITSQGNRYKELLGRLKSV